MINKQNLKKYNLNNTGKWLIFNVSQLTKITSYDWENPARAGIRNVRDETTVPGLPEAQHTREIESTGHNGLGSGDYIPDRKILKPLRDTFCIDKNGELNYIKEFFERSSNDETELTGIFITGLDDFVRKNGYKFIAINKEDAVEYFNDYGNPLVIDGFFNLESNFLGKDDIPPEVFVSDDQDIITDEEYNRYIENYSNNSIEKEFNKTSNKFFNQYEEFRRNFPELVQRIQKKFAEEVIPGISRPVDGGLWLGRKIEATDNEATKNSLKNAGRKWIIEGADIHIGKLLEAIDLMEELFEESSPKTPRNQSPDSLANFRQQSVAIINAALSQEPKLSNNDLAENNHDWRELINNASSENQINNIKDRVIIDIAAKRKAKKQKEKVSENIQTEGKTTEQLKRQLEELEKVRGQQSYEDNRNRINNLKKELANKISREEYLQIIANNVEKFLTKYDIKNNELDPETKKLWEKLKSGETKDFDQVNQAENEIIKNAAVKGASKKLDSLFKQGEIALKTGEKIKEIKNKLNNFSLSNEIYEKLLLSQERKKIESMLNQLENYSASHPHNSSSKFPWITTISIFLFTTFIVGVGIIIYRKQKKNKS